MDILSGRCRPIVDVRQSGSSPNLYEGTSVGGEHYSTAVNGSTLINTTTYSVTGLTNATTYYFTLKAVNAIGSSAPSNEAGWT